MEPDNPLRDIPIRVVGDASADPTEFFDHYDAFAWWAARKLQRDSEVRGRILDLGSPKMMCAMLSVTHDVTSVVLADCSDTISAVRYVRHDVADPLPFESGSFDAFTSTVALPLVGLGRYGDRLDPNCLPRLIRELDRVMTREADLLISMCLGPSFLAFNNGWYLDSALLSRLFRGWVMVDSLVDQWSSLRAPRDGARFRKSLDLNGIDRGDHRVVFLHFRRDSLGA